MGLPNHTILPRCRRLVRLADFRCATAAIETWVVSHIKQIIPESVQQQWHDWRNAAKSVEQEELGDNHVSEDIEKVGWGVEKAQEAHTADASKSTSFPSCRTRSWEFTVLGMRRR